jgi:5-methylcytosine-specific restriction endonuclease McrA
LYKEQSNRRHSSQIDRARVAVLERDGKCLRCGRTDSLHVHHKEHWEPGQENPHALDNLETLCSSCHRKEHPVPRGPDGRFVKV